MTEALHVGELEIVVVAANNNPSILNPDFLLRTKIVEEAWGWTLEQDPVTTPLQSQVSYKQGVLISAEFNRVVFRERIETNIPANTKIPVIARRYINTLPHVKYVAVGVNVKAHIETVTGNNPTTFITSQLLKTGPWSDYSSGPTNASVTLAYNVGDAKLSLTVTTTRLLGKDKPPALLFAANFHRDVRADQHQAILDRTKTIINGWQSDYNTFLDIVKNQFLNRTQQ